MLSPDQYAQEAQDAVWEHPQQAQVYATLAVAAAVQDLAEVQKIAVETAMAVSRLC